ncbi:hypothetical protein Pint_10608 [Pistacia integerrima]|uniref:Uncharacterized protein n=1 Tax=Pistacia integerrima TaxID=434235 RepID=A0ACC0XLP5_9ROSI|nr:hypothetical protein Pint_10608 [Pistacia integerrima]
MAEIKWVNLVYLILLSSGVCLSSQRELPAVKEEESYKQDNNIDGEEKWGIGGGIGGGFGGGIGGGIGIPGFIIGGGANIGGGAHGGIVIPGFNIGGGVNGGVSGDGGTVVSGLGDDISRGVSFGGGVARPCHVYYGKGVLVCKLLRQPQYWNGNALRGTVQSFDFGSSALNENASINDSKQDNNKHASNQKQAYENKGKTAEAVAPNSGWAYQNRN